MRKLVTISREYGSGFSKEIIEGAELKAKSSFSYNLASALNFSEGIGGSPLSVNEKVFLAQFQVIKEIGEKNEGVIVGRCADYVLKDMPGVTNVFVFAEFEDRVKRAIEVYGDEAAKAESLVSTYDKARQNYYNYHTCQKWGDYKNYNLSINSSYITEEQAANLIADYVERRTYR